MTSTLPGTTNTTGPSGADIAALVERRTPGYSLEAPFYTDPAIFDLDMKAIFAKHWLFSATEAEIPDPGDYVTIDIGPYSVIITRDDDEEVRAFHNTCRHRGARLLTDACGSVGNIVCPYHQWTYRVDGDLIFAEGQPDDFDRKAFGLRPVHTRTLAGLIFICLADTPPDDFDDVASKIEPYLAPFDLANAKVAHIDDFVEAGNWKLTMENNRECLHCDAGHPELITAYFPVTHMSVEDAHPRLRPAIERFDAANAALERVCSLANYPSPAQGHRDLQDRPTGFHVLHLPLDGAGTSFGVNGQAVSSKLMGTVTEPSFGDLSIHMQPNTWLHFLSDHAVVFRVLPLSATSSMVRTTWLVAPDAEDGVHYDLDALTQVWRATNAQDGAFVELTQRGVTDPGYRPGPYAKSEVDVDAFVTWYLNRVREHLDTSPTPGD